MILTPSNPIPIPQMACVCNFVQLCKDKEADFFHFEVGTIKADSEENIIIYGKDGLSKYSVFEIINKLLEENGTAGRRLNFGAIEYPPQRC